MPPLQRLKRIGAVRQMHRGGRDIVNFQCLQVLAQILPEAVLAVGFRRDITRRVAVLALVLAARVHVDAIAMPRREFSLVGKRTVPLDDPRTSHFQHVLRRGMGKEVKRHGRSVPLAQLVERGAVLLVDPLCEREPFVDFVRHEDPPSSSCWCHAPISLAAVISAVAIRSLSDCLLPITTTEAPCLPRRSVKSVTDKSDRPKWLMCLCKRLAVRSESSMRILFAIVISCPISERPLGSTKA